ncbi:phage tail domain-containing protein [Streptomyces sp. NPDC058960]|uniref:phage distal tail protein n=1 Tax=Streptomyces sp. NPDC058960 TaxID=3346679 RepID=UPI00368045DF
MAQQRLGRVQWGDLVFGPGSQYSVSAIEGLDDLPDVRGEDMERPGQHGDYTGPDYTGPRVIQLKLGLRADSPDELRALSLALRNATQPQRQPQALQFLDQDILVYGKIRKRSIPYDAEYLWSIGEAALEFYCADPYLYGLTEQSASTTAYSPAAGRTYPLAYGLTPTTLNSNPDFETALTPWNGQDGATLTRDNTQAQTGSWSMKIAPPGGTSGPRAESEQVPVTPGLSYRALGYLRCVTARQVALNVNWFNASHGYMSTSVNQAAVAANTWTLFSASFIAPAGAAYGQLAPTIPSTPPATDVMYVDEARFQQDVASGFRAYGSSGTSGRLAAVNDGAAPAYPVLRVDGPIAAPSIEQPNTGALLALSATLQAGEYVLIDTRSRAVLYMGTTPRRDWVVGGSTWPLLEPGDNTLTFRGSALPGAAGQMSLLTATWRDTSL